MNRAMYCLLPVLGLTLPAVAGPDRHVLPEGLADADCVALVPIKGLSRAMLPDGPADDVSLVLHDGTIVAVGRQAIGLRADYSLLTEIREFQAEKMGGGKVRVRINAKLIRQPRQIIVQSRSFEATMPDPSLQDMNATINAWDEALGSVLRKIVEWTIIEGETDYRQRQSQRR